MVELYLHFPIRLHDVAPNSLSTERYDEERWIIMPCGPTEAHERFMGVTPPSSGSGEVMYSPISKLYAIMALLLNIDLKNR
jgi:hypothetical protein